MYLVHIGFAYVIAFSGLACFITRIIPSIKWLHVWFGRCYIISMLGGTFTSLLIFNSGLPSGTIVSFIIVFFGLTFGWLFIKFHQSTLESNTLKQVEKVILNNPENFLDSLSLKNNGLDHIIYTEKLRLLRQKTFIQIVFSYKTAHALLMAASWYNIAGRIFVTRPSYEKFHCHTYPAYKFSPTGSNETVLLPASVPEVYNKLPWANNELGWFFLSSLGPMSFGLIVCVVYTFFRLKFSNKPISEVI
ncbi:hypothetical protein HK099_007959 [Clydaea vesicula]|uniref:Uncharacterized protein n=1 Tax=Clydaea vesicula TaxID=447962 RepID=A0AAD5XW38_9FUNG|nr:hypothetical protein HK099_007959 [Clydaea vesicula]